MKSEPPANSPHDSGYTQNVGAFILKYKIICPQKKNRDISVFLKVESCFYKPNIAYHLVRSVFCYTPPLYVLSVFLTI